MHTELHAFVTRLAGVVGLSLLPVIFTAFVSMPYTLERHPGEPLAAGATVHRHMT